MKIYFENDSPATNAIMGALVSGGDPIKLAEMLLESRRRLKDERGD